MSTLRKHLAGSSSGSLIAQQADELKRNSSCKRNILLKAGAATIPGMDNSTVLAMKEATELSWSQLRQQRRFLKQAGLSLPGEKKQRRELEELSVSNIVPEMVEFEKGGGSDDKEMHPFCRVDCIKDFIFSILDRRNIQNKLTWHREKIPENEIWVKFGGDHGGGSLKFTMQLGNVIKPNSKFNTIIIGIAKVKDTFNNLQKCMSFLTPQLEELCESEWMGKKIKLFIFGDYDFLTKLYGISGAQGTYPCIWCHEPKSSFQTLKKEVFKSRSLANLKKYNRR